MLKDFGKPQALLGLLLAYYMAQEDILTIRENDYQQWVNTLKSRFQTAKVSASLKVNNELMRFYLSVGKDISNNQFENRYGSQFYKRLSLDLQHAIPNSKGFSPTNLKYMRYFYELFRDEIQNHPQVVDDLVCLPWGHIRYIIDNCKNDSRKALFFVSKTIENNWSRAVLLNFLGTDLYDRQGKAVTNYSRTLPNPQGELAQQITKDSYNFDFLTLSEKYIEKELKDALVANIERFLLELGQGFAYMGREYRVKIGNTEKFMDMLFYNAKLHCYVVVEVKTEVFDAQNLGQLGLYVSAVNHLIKSPADNPTIGLLICRSKDNVVAKYALESTSLPIGISEYELAKVYPQDFQSTLPSIEQIEKELSKQVKLATQK